MRNRRRDGVRGAGRRRGTLPALQPARRAIGREGSAAANSIARRRATRGAAFGFPRLGHGPVWFGQVERPHGTISAVAKGHWICQYELPKRDDGGGGSLCVPPGAARELGLVDVSSCGKGKPTHFRIHALVPDGMTGVEVEREDGTVGRTVAVIENTVAFTIGRENIVLHGVGDAGAEGLERTLPLALAARRGDSRGGCSFYSFAESKRPN